ncbi:MAG: MFS transporter [Alicyclobacillus sp.]|nr:MFS transporter [Alicyclobacillus sp.]
MRRFWLGLGLYAMFVVGCADMLRGSAAPLMQADWNLSYGRLGLVFALGALGYLGGTLFGGPALARLGIRRVIAMGALTMALGTFAVAAAPGVEAGAAGLAAAGFGSGCLEVGVNAVIPRLTPSAHGQSRDFNWLHGFYGVGAFALPLAVGWLLQTARAWRPVYAVLGVAVAVVSAIAVIQRRHDIDRLNEPLSTHPATVSRPASPAMWRDPALWLLAFAIGVYVMAEVGIGNWLTAYLVDVRGTSLAVASMCLSGFYLTFTAGRLTAPLWLHRLSPRTAVLAAVAFSLLWAGVALLPWAGAPAGWVIAGFGFSIVFPTLTAIASHAFPSDSGRAIGVLFTAAGIGSIATNEVIGNAAARWGLGAGFALIAGFLAMVWIAAWQVQPKQDGHAHIPM